MTAPTQPLACPNCQQQKLEVTYQVFLTVQIVDGAITTLSGSPSDAGDFFVGLECGTCGFTLSGGGSGTTRRSELNNGDDTVRDDALLDEFVAVADRVTGFVEDQTITVTYPKGTSA